MAAQAWPAALRAHQPETVVVACAAHAKALDVHEA